MTDRSIAVEPRTEVSVWLNASEVIVSTLVGQCRVCDGEPDGRDRS